jgi:hypothetical protein
MEIGSRMSASKRVCRSKIGVLSRWRPAYVMAFGDM